MAAISGTISNSFLGGTAARNPLTSADLDALTGATYAPTAWRVVQNAYIGGSYNAYRQAAANNLAIAGSVQTSFFNDYYFRVHANPAAANLGTIASPQVVQVYLWNAFPNQNVTLNNVNLTNAQGVSISGQATPFVLKPNRELTYNVTVKTSGPPTVAASVQFDLAVVADPPPTLITGDRAVKFDLTPETPLKEVWDWRTDMMTAYDGTEQRAALRGEHPRVEMSLKFKFSSVTEINAFYADLLSAGNKIWIPEYQYATRSTAASAAGTSQIFYDNTKTDLRDGEYLLIVSSGYSKLVQISSINANGALAAIALNDAIEKDALLIPGSIALLDDGRGVSRFPADGAAEASFNALLTRQRATLPRQGSSVALTNFLTVPVLDRRPLADDMVPDKLSTGQISLDNRLGLSDIISRWDYARMSGERTYRVNRVQTPSELDFWKTFLAYCRGKARKFWTSTYRSDLTPVSSPIDGATAYTVSGTDYVNKIYQIPTHRYIEIETSSGTHRASVTGATLSGNNSVITFTPAVPLGSGWQNINRISYLLPCRLNDDKIEWEHTGLTSFLSISIKTAEV